MLGDTYANVERIDEALAAFQRGFDLAPNDFRQSIGLARISYLKGDTPIAKLILKGAIEASPTTALLYNNLGIIHAELGEQAEAKQCFEQANALEPQNPEFLKNMRTLLG